MKDHITELKQTIATMTTNMSEVLSYDKRLTEIENALRSRPVTEPQVAMSANTTDHSAQHYTTAQSSREGSGSNKDTKKVLLIGDSNLKYVNTRGLQDTIVMTRPGRRLKDISQELDTTDLQSYSHVHVVVHAGTNDITERDDEHDIANIGKEAKRLCTIVKDKHPRVKLALSGIWADRALPAAKVDPANAALRRVADERRVLYVDNEGSFQYRNGQLDESLYDRDRLHISRRRGASRLVSTINEVVPILPTQQDTATRTDSRRTTMPLLRGVRTRDTSLQTWRPYTMQVM
ncbi:Hypp2097 [Branchiostoma lanceolatum]|uniref:1-alkyl-2-acetylglycerophosphocholine esterase n=1 Tax=Branchiostoma lanceolatum TaxID=7740 RepID=A0A8J9ZNQ4_BRALA|nr:Hypp2097 [Branchiostoma lanceolatum]